MRDTLPKMEDLPGIFPVFPLAGALLLPGGRLPLNIFEPRYLAMVEDALASGRMFAMIQSNERLGTTPHGPALHGVGCLGRLSSFSETEDGRRYLITLNGLIRFSVVREVEMQRGYRRVEGDFSRFAADLEQGSAPLLGDRAGLLEALRSYFDHRGFDADWDSIGAMDDETLVTSLSMVCPFDPIEKQALLEVASLEERAETLRTLLRIDLHDWPRDPDDEPPERRMAS